MSEKSTGSSGPAKSDPEASKTQGTSASGTGRGTSASKSGKSQARSTGSAGGAGRNTGGGSGSRSTGGRGRTGQSAASGASKSGRTATRSAGKGASSTSRGASTRSGGSAQGGTGASTRAGSGGTEAAASPLGGPGVAVDVSLGALLNTAERVGEIVSPLADRTVAERRVRDAREQIEESIRRASERGAGVRAEARERIGGLQDAARLKDLTDRAENLQKEFTQAVESRSTSAQRIAGRLSDRIGALR